MDIQPSARQNLMHAPAPQAGVRQQLLDARELLEKVDERISVESVADIMNKRIGCLHSRGVTNTQLFRLICHVALLPVKPSRVVGLRINSKEMIRNPLRKEIVDDDVWERHR